MFKSIVRKNIAYNLHIEFYRSACRLWYTLNHQIAFVLYNKQIF